MSGANYIKRFIEYRIDDITFFFFFFLHFSIVYWWSMMKNIHIPNLVGIGSWGPEIWLHEYLISPTEISVNWPGSKLIRYSCGHISGHHEPIHVKLGVWGFFIMFYWNMVMKMLKCKKRKYDDVTLHYSLALCGNVPGKLSQNFILDKINRLTWNKWVCFEQLP